MRAARFYKAGDIRVEDIPEPVVSPGGVKLRVEWCGLCGTDIAEYKFGPLGAPVEPHPLTGETVPVVLGHELTGTVVEVGRASEGINPGDRVLVDPTLRCNSCRQCQRGRYNLCDFLGIHGLSGGGGGLAEFTVVPDYTLHRLPDDLDMAMATLAEPVAVALRAISRSRVSPSSSVCLFGAGPIGLVLAACLSSIGVDSITVVEPSHFRRRIALDLGCELAIAPDELPDTAVLSGKFDVVYEASGTQEGLDGAIAATSAGGILMHMARFKQGANLAPNLLRREIDLISTQAYINEISEAIEIVASDSIPLEQIVSDRVNLSSVVERGFEQLSQHPVKMGKVLVSCQETVG